MTIVCVTRLGVELESAHVRVLCISSSHILRARGLGSWGMALRVVQLVICVLTVLLSVAKAEDCCVKVDTATKQLIDARGEMESTVCGVLDPSHASVFYLHTLVCTGRARLFHGMNVVCVYVHVVLPYHKHLTLASITRNLYFHFSFTASKNAPNPNNREMHALSGELTPCVY